jgi:hypothetical protein
VILISSKTMPSGQNQPSTFRRSPLVTYDRLIDQGHSDEEARRLIGYAIASEVVGILNESREYDHRRCLAALEALPRLS